MTCPTRAPACGSASHLGAIPTRSRSSSPLKSPRRISDAALANLGADPRETSPHRRGRQGSAAEGDVGHSTQVSYRPGRPVPAPEAYRRRAPRHLRAQPLPRGPGTALGDSPPAHPAAARQPVAKAYGAGCHATHAQILEAFQAEIRGEPCIEEREAWEREFFGDPAKHLHSQRRPQ